MPRLSVVVPVRNQAERLEELLARLEALQAPAGWEVETVVGYTASEDATAAVIDAAGVKRIDSQRIGPSAARNAAAGAANGDLLYFIDADAVPIADDHLVRLVSAAARFRRFGALGGPVLLAPSQRFNPIAQADHLACWFLWGPLRPRGPSDFQPSVNLVVPRLVFERLGGFDESLRVLEDFDFAMKVRGARLPMFYEPELSVYHHARGGLLSSWRHSWYWGAPAREAFYARVATDRYPHSDNRARFWVNFPRLLAGRLRVVLKIGWHQSRLVTVLCLPFLLATVTAWAVAVCVGKGQPGSTEPAPT